MEITQTNASAITPVNGAAEAPPKPAVSSDFETFLKMLTVQLENQDPLNPIESADYAVQLATFSGVEQQVKTNDLLEAMVSQMRSSDMSALAGWVGMEARVEGPVHFDGSPVTLMLSPVAAAEQSFLVVSDQNGGQLQRTQINPADKSIVWAGVGDGGEPLANGSYNFHVESFAGGQNVGNTATAFYGKIAEAKNELGNILLVLENGTEVSTSDVSALRVAA